MRQAAACDRGTQALGRSRPIQSSMRVLTRRSAAPSTPVTGARTRTTLQILGAVHRERVRLAKSDPARRRRRRVRAAGRTLTLAGLGALTWYGSKMLGLW